ncbi:hypothetical protein BD414DRAFT_529972 [Trametes punicea]|nr:hypothetical protein BD414DRAFT_529972 [Trametes punicea]
MNTPDGYDPNCGYTWDANGRIQTFRVPASQPAESASTHAEAGPSQSGTSTALQQAPIIHSTSSSVPPALSPASTTPSTHFTGVCYVPSPVVHSSSNTATIRATGGAQLVTGSSSSLAIQVEHEQPGGSTERTHGKGKKRAVEAEPVAQKPSKRTKASASAAAAELDSGARQGGRQMGSSNYTEKDLRALMKAVRKVLPTGGDGWERVRAIFNAWAKRHGRPVRETKPLKNKFEALSRTRKPTGKATLPWYVKVAKKLDHRINGKVELHELDDSEMSNDSAGSSLGEDQVTLSELSDASVGGASLSNSSDIEVLEPPSNAHQSPSDPRSTETNFSSTSLSSTRPAPRYLCIAGSGST